ncbi:MAG TPA: alpha/beta fold hydrolase [bacterium]|nr:alpha/beta fold hydrolase [bacterium]
MEFFTSPHNSVKIAFDIFPSTSEKGRILFLTGRAEYYLKYERFFNLMNENGFSVYAMDHRGQGASGRMLENPQKGYVENFDFFVEDADFFLKNIVLKDIPGHVPVFSISHSMGGAVSLLLGMKNPGLFQKMVFCSPMWGINFGKTPEKAVFFLSTMMCLLGKGKNYAPGKGDYDQKTAFENNRLTHDPELFSKQKSFLHEHPSFVLGGPTNRWVNESLKAIKKIKNNKLQPGCPVLLLQAGADLVVSNANQDIIIKKIELSTRIVIKNSWHELLYEEKTIYSQTVSQILNFLHY